MIRHAIARLLRARSLPARLLPARLLRDRAGVAAIEATITIGLILAPLSLGVIDYATALTDMVRLDQALQSAVYYVWNNQTGYTNAGITAAADAGFGAAAPTPTVTTTTACSCVSSGYSKVSSVSCAGSCPTNQTVATYLTITVSASFTLPVTVPTLTSPWAQSLSGTIRIK
jgi:Flp pilus assembly protein TadG